MDHPYLTHLAQMSLTPYPKSLGTIEFGKHWDVNWPVASWALLLQERNKSIKGMGDMESNMLEL